MFLSSSSGASASSSFEQIGVDGRGWFVAVGGGGAAGGDGGVVGGGCGGGVGGGSCGGVVVVLVVVVAVMVMMMNMVMLLMMTIMVVTEGRSACILVRMHLVVVDVASYGMLCRKSL